MLLLAWMRQYPLLAAIHVGYSLETSYVKIPELSKSLVAGMGCLRASLAITRNQANEQVYNTGL